MRWHSKPIGHAQALTVDIPRFAIAGIGARCVPVQQQPQDRTTMQPQTRQQIGGQVCRAISQPITLGRQFDSGPPQGQQERGEFARVRFHSSPQPSLASVAVFPTRSPMPKALTPLALSILGGVPSIFACISPRCSLAGV